MPPQTTRSCTWWSCCCRKALTRTKEMRVGWRPSICSSNTTAGAARRNKRQMESKRRRRISEDSRADKRDSLGLTFIDHLVKHDCRCSKKKQKAGGVEEEEDFWRQSSGRRWCVGWRPSIYLSKMTAESAAAAKTKSKSRQDEGEEVF